MKFRSDFVTNSSSSSFIGVFAKLGDYDKALSVLADHNLDEQIQTGKQILEDISRKYFYGYGADWAGIDITPRKDKIDPDAYYIVWESYDGADDNSYTIFDDDGYIEDYDYSAVDLVDFENYEISIYTDITEENGFVDIDKGYGAGRDG